MSYDISIGTFERNYTSNRADLYRDHFPGGERLDENGVLTTVPAGLDAIHDKTGREAGEILLEMISAINDTRIRLGNDRVKGDQPICDQYDSPNGWGSLVGQLIFLGEIAAACAMHPDEKVFVCS